MQVIWTGGLLFACNNTIQSHAYMLNNLHGPFIVVIGFIQGKQILLGEWFGLWAAFIGCGIMVLDPWAGRTQKYSDGIKVSHWLTELINFVSALFGALYFIMNARNVQKLPVISLIFFMNLHLFFINALVAKFTPPTEGKQISIFSFENHGCLGFFNENNALFAFV